MDPGDALATARRAVELVRADLDGASTLRPDVRAEPATFVGDGGVAIVVDGSEVQFPIAGLTEPEATAEIASLVQDLLAQPSGLWPICAEHDVGLHADVHDGLAVWRCRLHGHTAAAIGDLAEPEQGVEEGPD